MSSPVRLRIVLALAAAAASTVVALPAAPSAVAAEPPRRPATDGLNHPDVQPPGPVRGVSNTVRLGGARTAGSDVREVHTDGSFSMVGVRWSGTGPDRVEVRHRGQDGGWSAWTALDPSDDHPELGRSSTATEPLWTGPTRDVQVRAHRAGRPVTDALELVTIDPGTAPTDAKLGAAVQAQAMPGMPTVVSRAQWGADESIMTWPPEWAWTTKAVSIHHTAGTNDYTCDQSAALIRGVYRYHSVTNGWGDIGYNVLVDKCGTIFEGRSGGLRYPTIGAHSGGFNTYTFGISMLGTFSTVVPSGPQLESVSAMAAWKLAGSYRDPVGSTVLVSTGGGTARWPAGTPVHFPTIFGHRDSGYTECPGNAGYAQLGWIRNRVVQLAGDWRSSPIHQKWQALGGDNGFTSGVFRVESAHAPGGRSASFTGSGTVITWHSSTGAHWLSGAILGKWQSAGEAATLGFPTSDQFPTAGANGMYVLFGPNRAIIWGAATGARLVADDFLARLRADGDVARFGLPQTERIPLPGRDTFQQFQYASIFATPSGALAVGWGIRQAWWNAGGYTGRLGMPTGQQQSVDGAGGVRQRFEGGVITCSGSGSCVVG